MFGLTMIYDRETARLIGYRISEVEALLGTNRRREFEEYMRGKTVGIANGEHIVYPNDLKAFFLYGN